MDIVFAAVLRRFTALFAYSPIPYNCLVAEHVCNCVYRYEINTNTQWHNDERELMMAVLLLYFCFLIGRRPAVWAGGISTSKWIPYQFFDGLIAAVHHFLIIIFLSLIFLHACEIFMKKLIAKVSLRLRFPLAEKLSSASVPLFAFLNISSTRSSATFRVIC